MTRHREPDELLDAYLAEGMQVLPDRVVDAVLDEVHRTRQRAVFGPWRIERMNTVLKLALHDRGRHRRRRDRQHLPAPKQQRDRRPGCRYSITERARVARAESQRSSLPHDRCGNRPNRPGPGPHHAASTGLVGRTLRTTGSVWRGHRRGTTTGGHRVLR